MKPCHVSDSLNGYVREVIKTKVKFKSKLTSKCCLKQQAFTEYQSVSLQAYYFIRPELTSWSNRIWHRWRQTDEIFSAVVFPLCGEEMYCYINGAQNNNG